MAFQFEIRHGMLIFVLVGGIFAAVGAWVHATGERTKQWPVTDGTVIDSRLEPYMSTSSSGSGSSRRTTTTEMFRPRIRYRYQVDGREYQGTRVWAVDYSSSDAADMQAVVNRYPPEQAIQVHYDPENPAEAVLETGAGWLGRIFMGIGLFFVILGLVLYRCLAGVRTMPRPSTHNAFSGFED